MAFTSHNLSSPYLLKTHGGSAGLLQGAMGGTFEGGMREPAKNEWAGTIQPKVVMDPGTTTDLLPTFCSLSDIKLPDDKLGVQLNWSLHLYITEGDPQGSV